MTETTPVVILGAGLTGLSAAAHLELPSRLIEREDHVGGHCVTVEDHGFHFDRTGHLLHLRDASIRRWVESILDEEPLRIQRRSRIWSHGCYTRYPFQANTFGLPPAVARECLLGFLEARDAELAAERSGEREPPASFEEFILRYMGQGIADHFMIPYNTKLWGLPPREMSSVWTERFVPRPTLDEVVSGAVGCHDQELGYNAEFLYPRKGIGALAQALERVVGHVELGVEPRGIDVATKTIHLSTGEQVRYDALISTIPLDRLLPLLGSLPASVTDAGRRLRCHSLHYLDVALKRPPKQPLHWVYVPEERYPFYRVGAYSSFSEALAPPGCGSLYIELSSREAPDLTTLLPEVIDGLIEMAIIDDADEVEFARARFLNHAYVVYDHGYRDARETIHPFLREHDIFSCGRYGSWEYSAMEDALIGGREAARLAMEAR
jgi:protoporphyrinogen oxidase